MQFFVQELIFFLKSKKQKFLIGNQTTLTLYKVIFQVNKKIIKDEIKKRLLLGDNNLITENNDEQSNSSKTIISLKLFHKNELFRIKVQFNILISLLKKKINKTLQHYKRHHQTLL